MNSLRKQLRVLDCPFVDKITSLDAITNQGLLICWLEDRKISELEVNERSGLQPNSAKWSHNVKKYLSQLGCPFNWLEQLTNDPIPEENVDALMWLVSTAVNLEYQDCQENMDVEEEPSTLKATNHSIIPSQATTNTESNGALIRKCEELGAVLELPRKTNETTIDYLRRLSLKVKLSMTLLNDASTTTAPLDSFELGFTTGDKIMDEVAVVLRMLYLSDFRELQNEANGLIVLGQEYTANPRLNTALGKVGR